MQSLEDASLDALLKVWPEIAEEYEHLDQITWCVEPDQAREGLRACITDEYEELRDELMRRRDLTRQLAQQCDGGDGWMLHLIVPPED